MFVETECPEPGVLIAHRRPRSPDEPADLDRARSGCRRPGKLAKPMACNMKRTAQSFSAAAIRPENPAALRTRLSGSDRHRDRSDLQSPVPRRARPAGAAGNRVADDGGRHPRSADGAGCKIHAAGAVSRAFEMAWTRAQLEFRFLGIGPAPRTGSRNSPAN